ncbi:prolyl oligopeptidase family serine peptidase [Chitinophaga sp. SYP-B3965]|uniref:alpha/beta hydrolase family protein n=1 Tax=Chitinophaga sp. SYP-B3965 TaxID=2663120 RepID=UPI001299EC24|nr:prolyl oligopeptidase family serine peptidase [Chitinophaga sp. SYP-B3965]MRG45391.1 prolyl oligopeptidase family serine peptidase [Chitinophaga sp. SYP-B3965]
MRKSLFALSLLATTIVHAQDNVTYQRPPAVIEELLLAKPVPFVSVDKKGEWMILTDRNSYPTVEELAQPELRVAGLRLNPRNFGPSRVVYHAGYQLKNIKTKELFPITGLPQDLRGFQLSWSPDGKLAAFTNSGNNRIDLYVIDIATKAARKVNEAPLNTALGQSFYTWLDNNRLVYKVVPAGTGALPVAPLAPKGPVVQESKGRNAASRTYQDLIKSPYDEQLFAYMTHAQLVINDLQTEKPIGKPGIYAAYSVSPDKQYLLVREINKPFSYLITANGFPHTVAVMDLQGNTVKSLAKNPSSEGAPIGFDDVENTPRNFSWKADEPHTIYFVKALDEGLGRKKSEYRDAVLAADITTNAEPKELFRTKRRFDGVVWGTKELALVYESLFADRRERISIYNSATGKLDSLFEKSSNDAYSEIGSPVTTRNQYDRPVLFVQKNGELLLRSQGSSPEGDLPFVQSYNLKTGKGNILWRCQAPFYESVVDVLDPEKLIMLTSRESQTEAPNYYIRDLKKRSLIGTPITDFTNPYKAMEGVSKQKISYKRADGVDLTGDLYLPKGYDAKKDGPLPVVIWAYPREYKSAADAAQVRGSRYTFTRVGYGGPIFWVTQGYAILDNAEMPIVGEGNKEPNDNFIPQLYLNAHAAIQALAKMGVGDSNRVAVGGHSYGAFMTANLLAHTKLFKAGIARSGAYNRTLTPFGFQAEERTYWQAPEVYFNMSPFSFADKIKTPLLMIHGEMDNNPGTFPIQSERLYNAIKGHGGTVRFVQLPFESHGYSAKENLLHLLWEQDQWLKTYVKDAK